MLIDNEKKKLLKHNIYLEVIVLVYFPLNLKKIYSVFGLHVVTSVNKKYSTFLNFKNLKLYHIKYYLKYDYCFFCGINKFIIHIIMMHIQ